MSDEDALRQQLSALLTRLSPSARRKALRVVALDIRRLNQRRIAAQTAPDGSAFAPRKPRKAATRKGAVRRRANAMFARLRLARHMKAGASDNEAWVQFTGRAARIARVHHDGLMDSVGRRGPRIRYERRELLGFGAEDEARILDAVMDHLVRR